LFGICDLWFFGPQNRVKKTLFFYKKLHLI
jgi:hypothetical protein